MSALTSQVLYALIGGLIPALIWLLFWLREDIHPEPKRLLAKAFLVGIVAIPFALGMEMSLYCLNAYLFYIHPDAEFCGTARPLLQAYAPIAALFLIIGFAAAEEVVKYLAARVFVLHGKDFDEPVDAMIYLITVALGFAAFENFFFLLPAFGNNFFEGLVVSNLRFLGATLLHAVSSGVLGYIIALSFYDPERKTRAVISGLLTATLIHTIFNILVLQTEERNPSFGQALAMLILTSMFLIFAFDRVKKIKQANRYQSISTSTSYVQRQ